MLLSLRLGFSLCLSLAAAELKSGPPLAYHTVKDWAQLPEGWNFGETSGVAVDKNDNVWVFNRGPHPVMQFNKDGKFLRSWSEVPVTSSHGIKVAPDGNIWLVDVKGHQVMEFTPEGRVRMVIGNVGKRPAANNDTKDAFNEPTAVSFLANGDFYLSDGYQNARVVKYSRDGIYQFQWGKKGKGDGEFDLVHDVTTDKRGLVYVADRTNERVQIFDENGKFLRKWTGIGAAWGLAYSASDDTMFMCDGVNDRIVKLNMDGEILGVLSGHGKVPGRLDFPHHMAIDSTGALYVAEIKNWRVQKFVRNGK
jgi:DNA-binding beta-propeller fold protein YncE